MGADRQIESKPRSRFNVLATHNSLPCSSTIRLAMAQTQPQMVAIVLGFARTAIEPVEDVR